MRTEVSRVLTPMRRRQRSNRCGPPKTARIRTIVLTGRTDEATARGLWMVGLTGVGCHKRPAACLGPRPSSRTSQQHMIVARPSSRLRPGSVDLRAILIVHMPTSRCVPKVSRVLTRGRPRQRSKVLCGPQRCRALRPSRWRGASALGGARVSGAVGPRQAAERAWASNTCQPNDPQTSSRGSGGRVGQGTEILRHGFGQFYNRRFTTIRRERRL